MHHRLLGSTAAAYLIERRQALPRINTIERFAALLGVSPSWLAYGEGPEDAVQAGSTVGGIRQRLESARKERGPESAGARRCVWVDGADRRQHRGQGDDTEGGYG